MGGVSKYAEVPSCPSSCRSDDKGEFANIFNQAVLEINPNHPIISHLAKLHEEDEQGEEAKETVEIVFNTAALAAGYILDNAAEYSNLVVKIMARLAKA